MRRVFPAAAVAVVAMAAPGTAFATTGQVRARTLCTVTDDRITEQSGLAAGGDRLYLMNDGGTQVRVFVLDRECAVWSVITADVDPYDPEDLALGADGTVWIGDVGDNSHRRDTVALVAVRPDGTSEVYRLSYPDGAHNAEALLLDRAGTPYIVTKDPFGAAGVYRPEVEMTKPGPTPLHKVGSLDVGPTDTPGGPLPAGFGSVVVTGAAVSHDGTVVAIRTYTDVYLYPAPDGDVEAALRRKPTRVPLPNEQQGESVAFLANGTLLAGSEGVDQPIVAIPDAVSLVDDTGTVAPTTTASHHGAVAKSAGGRQQDRAPESPWRYGVGGGIALAAVAAVCFYLARRRSRRD